MNETEILKGRLENLPKGSSGMVSIFLSSTFSGKLLDFRLKYS